MHILLYAPDNQVTRNFIPQLWPFFLQALTPKEHRVTIIDGNAQHLHPYELVQFINQEHVDLVGMGFMTRMAQSAYRMAAAIRQANKVPIVMGGPHVTAVPDEPLGLMGQPQHADAVVIGEADYTWPQVVRDTTLGKLQRVYRPATIDGEETRPTLADYPAIPWEDVDLSLFNLMRFVPPGVKRLLRHLGFTYDNVYAIPVETGRGCPYGCEFCTVTGFFGNDMRFRSNEDVVTELLRLKTMAKQKNGLPMVFFVDDNFAINRARTKSLLRDMIRYDACIPWTGQISINLLQDEELVQLIAGSGGRWIFMGLESVDPVSLKLAHKEFNKPGHYEAVLNTLAKYNLYGITSFIYGLDGDGPGVSRNTVAQIDQWPPCLSVFGLLTPYPGTPLYDRLQVEGRVTRPQHWLDFRPFKTAYLPKGLTPEEAEAEVRHSWHYCYAPAAFRQCQTWLVDNHKSFGYQLMHFVARMLFRGIYFPQMTRWAWIRLLAQNTPTLGSLMYSGLRSQLRIKALRTLPQLAGSHGQRSPDHGFFR
jgi:radical SAM superfamily enzyme YgiQ (UPF0313 family)